MESKIITVALNLNPKYLHRDIIKTHIQDLLNKNVLNGCFNDLGKVTRINKIISIGLGKIHIDTGFSKTPVTFEANVYMPKVDDIVNGIVEKYDSNGGMYVNYNDIVSIFCLNVNLNLLFDKNTNSSNKRNTKYNDNINLIDKENDIEQNIGKNVKVKITKVNFNEQNMIVLGKII